MIADALPALCLGVMASVTVVVLAASYVPARRASRLDPMVVLRTR